MSEQVMEPDYQLPELFLARMKRLLGGEYEAFLKSYEADRVQGLRFNTQKGSISRGLELCGEAFGLRQIPWCREGFYYKAESRPGRHPYHEAGVYYIQEPSAMAVVELLNPCPGDRVLDLCAAPGGKTTHIAERLEGQGVLVSNEIMPNRAKILSQNVERMGIVNAVVTNEDSGKLSTYFPEFFDRIVVDAPCSGEGMFRKDMQAREEWSEENVRICAKRQQEILDNAAVMLRDGGRLVYSTCTFAPEEDEGAVASFLCRHPEFSVVSVPDTERPQGLSCAVREWAEQTGDYPEEILNQITDTFRIWPHKTDGEGHYLALLEKHGETGEDENEGVRYERGKSKKGGKKKNGKGGFWKDKAGLKLLQESMQELFGHSDASPELDYEHLLLFGDQIFMVPEGLPSLDGLRVLRPGLHLGTLLKNRMEPSHALALALRPEQAGSCVALSSEDPDTLSYLKGSTLSVSAELKGWALVTVDGYSLGWGKAAGGTMKNHYPKGLRIQG